MAKNREDLKILYIQIRDDEATKEEEFDEFSRYGKLKREQFTVLNVFDTPEFEPNVINGHDALFVGGTSDASITKPEKYPFVESIKKLIKYCADESIPVFASCFGFQGAVVALGGKLKMSEKERMEAGTYKITLTKEGKKDILFGDSGDSFSAVSFHKEMAAELPEGAILLAFSEFCPIHAFKLEGKPFYATQFHPEVNDIDLIARLIRYIDRYFNATDGSEKLRQITKDTVPTPEANAIIKKFVDRILLKQEI